MAQADTRPEANKTKNPAIVAWMKPFCGWSNGVRAVFQKYGLAYDDRDIINIAANYAEMVERTGQTMQPCIAIDEHVLIDVSGEEVEAWLIEHNYVEQNDAEPEVPIDRACENEAVPKPVSLQMRPR
ncbi:MAG: glutaredoxin [Chloroflexi bacterium]|nr:glutaredoxin [Chloroflexota bacterium]